MIELLSEPQREMYDLFQSGLTPEQVGQKLGKDMGTVRAQITRIKNKGVKIPEFAQPMTSGLPSADDAMHRPLSEPPRDRRSEFDIINEAEQAGPAKYTVDEAVGMLKEKFNPSATPNDTHPMALLGVTIQFMKLAGGRLAAHQLIEDVYAALKAITNDQHVVPEPEGEQKADLRDVLISIQQQLAKVTS